MPIEMDSDAALVMSGYPTYQASRVGRSHIPRAVGCSSPRE